MLRAIATLCLLLFVTILPLAANDAPVRTEQAIYSILAYNGKDFSPTFCRQDSDSIFLLAGVDSVLSMKKAFVYYWPLTEDWRTDASVLDVTFGGVLEIHARNERIAEIHQVGYTYFNIRGVYENDWHVATGPDAEQEVLRYKTMVSEYIAASDRFRAANREFEMLFDAIASRITELKNRGLDYSELAERIQELERPPEPEEPSYYTAPPSKPAQGFVVNLAAGEYDILFRNPDGSVMEGSEKHLMVYSPAETNGVGYSVIPGDKWTRPADSTTPSSVIYVNGKTDLYVNPYYQDLVNDLYYNRMVKNDSTGNPNILNWVRIQQVVGATIEVVDTDGVSRAIPEEPFMVEQTETASLGYRIVPYDPDGAHKNYRPSIIAYRLPIAAGNKVTRLRLYEDDASVPRAGSARQIRIVDASRKQQHLVIFALLPLAAMAAVLITRRRKIAQQEASKTLTAS
jgi:hypothetical protein